MKRSRNLLAGLVFASMACRLLSDVQQDIPSTPAPVLTTADGAQTWPSGAQVQALGAFLDLQHAWVIFSSDQQLPASAVVWRTNDNGQTWTASAPLEHEVFGQHVWAEFAAWVRTSNGGAAWIEIKPAIG